MADTKVSALPAVTVASDDNLLYLVTDPSGTPLPRRITVANVIASIQGTGSGDVAAGDHNHTGVYQPLDSDLTTIAGLTATTDNFLQSKSSAWASRTPTQVTADLIAVVGDSGSGGTKGLVPAPASGDAAANKYLKADGTWATVAGGVSDGNKGDITVSGTGATWAINAGAVTYADIQDVSATDKLLGRATSGAGDVEEIACTAAGRALLDDTTIFAQKTTLGIVYGYKTSADQTTTSATGVDVTGMSFSIAASETWVVDFYLGVTVSGANGMKVALTVPSGATMYLASKGTQATPSVTTTSGTLSTNIANASPTGIHLHALIQNSTNAGTVQLQFASGDGVVSAAIKQNQAYFIANRLA